MCGPWAEHVSMLVYDERITCLPTGRCLRYYVCRCGWKSSPYLTEEQRYAGDHESWFDNALGVHNNVSLD